MSALFSILASMLRRLIALHFLHGLGRQGDAFPRAVVVIPGVGRFGTVKRGIHICLDLVTHSLITRLSVSDFLQVDDA